MMRNKKIPVRAKDITGIQVPDTLVLGAFAYSYLGRTRNCEKCGIVGSAFGEDPYLGYRIWRFASQ
jgi:hypothetical protein